jgi:pimeloyl-ACP methyl ester carboxylesterase
MKNMEKVMSEARHPDAPEWYRQALDVSRTDEVVEVDDCPIHYLAWGEKGRRGIVFVHGGGAHAHWWTHVAARYANCYRVAAIDLSGHGDSGRRERYSLEGWTNEVMTVAHDSDMSGQPVLVGHSMGGFVTIATSALHPGSLAGVVVCDSPVSAPDPEIDAHRMGAAFGKPRAYASRAEALERFRTVPLQDHYLDYVMADVGYHSLRETREGWRWKFDPLAFTAFDENPRVAARPYLPRVSCRLALLASECGLVTEDVGAYMYDLMGRVNPVIEIPLAGHHVMLDQPLSLISAINTLLADWDHSEPRRREGLAES